jgi:plastocyanin domain-containing protein
MDTAEVLVLIGSALAIAGVVWYFFLSDKPKAVAATVGGVQTLKVTVKGGYNPSTLEVTAGRPVRIEFFRDETNPCSETVVFGDFGVAKVLAPHKTTPVEFTPEKAGKYGFECGMGMLHGTLVVKEGEVKP